MVIKVVDSGERIALQMMVNNGVAPEDNRLRLYQNDYQPNDADTPANYTEADFTGYASTQLLGGLWTAIEGNPSSVEYPLTEFICTQAPATPQTIYGYYLTRAVAGDLMWVERFLNPVTIAGPGDRVLVTPRIEARDTTDVVI